MISYLSGKGIVSALNTFLKGDCPDSNSVFGDIGATHADLNEAVQSFVCVLIGIHNRGLAPNIHV